MRIDATETRQIEVDVRPSRVLERLGEMFKRGEGVLHCYLDKRVEGYFWVYEVQAQRPHTFIEREATPEEVKMWHAFVLLNAYFKNM